MNFRVPSVRFDEAHLVLMDLRPDGPVTGGQVDVLVPAHVALIKAVWHSGLWPAPEGAGATAADLAADVADYAALLFMSPGVRAELARTLRRVADAVEVATPGPRTTPTEVDYNDKEEPGYDIGYIDPSEWRN